MIIAINLSTPVRKIKDKIDINICEAKMKNSNIVKCSKIILGTLTLLMVKNTNANAQDILSGTNMSAQVVESLNAIGYPTVDLIFNLVQMKDHFKNMP